MNGLGKIDKQKDRQAGFALIELMVALIVFAVLTVIAVPSINAWLPQYRLKNAAIDLFSNIQLAKITAIQTGANCTITFGQTIDGATYDYVIYEDSDNDLEYDAGENVIRKILWSDYKNVSLDFAEGGGDGLTFANNDDNLPSVAFRPNGLTMNNGGAYGGGVVFLKNGNNQTKSVIITAAGGVDIS